MSESLELVRSIYEAQGRGDYSSADWAAPGIEYEIADGPSPGRWRGRRAMAEAWREIISAWHDLRIEAQGYREFANGRVLVLTRSSARGRASGVELAPEWTSGAAIYDIRDGKVTKHVVYFDRSRALADLGLAE